MARTLIVALAGKKGAGKTTFANWLLAELQRRGVSAETKSFAGLLRDESFKAGILKHPGNTEYRDFMCMVGDGVKAITLDSTVFANYLMTAVITGHVGRMYSGDHEPHVVIIDDLRYRAELFAVHASSSWFLGGSSSGYGMYYHTIRLEGGIVDENPHTSETDLETYEMNEELNLDDLPALRKAARHLAREIRMEFCPEYAQDNPF